MSCWIWGDVVARLPYRLFALVSFTALSACGTSLPVQDFRNPSYTEFNNFVYRIASHVRCELGIAVQLEASGNPKRETIVSRWAARVALTIRANDKGQFAPSVSAFNDAMSFTFGAGGRLMSDATREMTMTYFLPFADLLANRFHDERTGKPVDCTKQNEGKLAEPIAGDLGIHQSLAAALNIWDPPGNLPVSKNGPYDTITHHVTFVVEAEGTATPTWKLVRVSGGSQSNFLSASKTQTDELLITMGPAVLSGRNDIVASRTLDETFNIERLRSAVTVRPFLQ